jgi:hypothetical protein
MAMILRPLTNSTRGSPKATAAVDWKPPMVAAFDAARTALGAAALLAHPQQDQELAVMVDASADHVGAALQQRRSAAADWQPLAFFSKKLEPAQIRYSTFDRELFACVAGIRHLRYMLEGRPFTIYTDHKPLTFALGKVSEPWTAMQPRQPSYVAEFTTDIWHIPGSENIVADTLSRPPPAALLAAATGGPVVASPVNLDYARIAVNQRSCQETLKAAHSSSLQLQHVDMQGERVICDTSTGQPRPLIPVADPRDVFRAIHELAHDGIRATRRLMAARVVWRGMASEKRPRCGGARGMKKIGGCWKLGHCKPRNTGRMLQAEWSG